MTGSCKNLLVTFSDFNFRVSVNINSSGGCWLIASSGAIFYQSEATDNFTVQNQSLLLTDKLLMLLYGLEIFYLIYHMSQTTHKIISFFAFSAIWWFTNILRCIVCVESSQLLTCAGQQFLGAVDDSTLLRTCDLRSLLAWVECCEQKKPKLFKNCKKTFSDTFEVASLKVSFSF